MAENKIKTTIIDMTGAQAKVVEPEPEIEKVGFFKKAGRAIGAAAKKVWNWKGTKWIAGGIGAAAAIGLGSYALGKNTGDTTAAVVNAVTDAIDTIND